MSVLFLYPNDYFQSCVPTYPLCDQVRKDKTMKNLLDIVSKRPGLFEQSPKNIWDDEYISKNMLKAHLDETVDSATRTKEFVESSVEWISRLMPPQKYPFLLDLGCGPGIYAELFYRRGYHVSGIDLSDRSITYAKKSARDQKLDIHYSRGDYTKMDFCCRYNLITLIYCDFGVLPADQRRILLTKVYNSLLPGGVFVFDVFTPLRFQEARETRNWEVCEKGFWDEKLCLTLQSFYRYDEDHTILNQYVTVTENNLSYYNVWEHTFTLKELEQDLQKAGFGRISFYGDAAGRPCAENDDTVCVLAVRQPY